MSQKPIERLIDSNVHCLRCGARGVGTCDCRVRCSCGWYADRGQPCNNPATTRCSTKLKYRRADREHSATDGGTCR